MTVTTPALLLLADGRFPSGAHAHSSGLEAAVNQALVADAGDLARWAEGCAHTVWRLEAAAAAQAAGLVARGTELEAADLGAWRRLDTELEARVTSAPLRTVARTLGRQLLRAGRAAWPHPSLELVATVHPDGPAGSLALGAITAAAGSGPADAALVSLHHAAQGAATAAVRLLGLDPYQVTAWLAALGPSLAAIAAEAAALGDDPADLPSAGAPMLDILLAAHQRADGRLFAS